jgi:hypothetical protein
MMSLSRMTTSRGGLLRMQLSYLLSSGMNNGIPGQFVALGQREFLANLSFSASDKGRIGHSGSGPLQ